MESTLDWNFCKCLVWETEKPFRDRPRKSPAFYFQGHIWHFSFILSLQSGARCYSLHMKCDETVSIGNCNITVQVKKKKGCMVMSQTSIWDPRHPLWGNSERDILQDIRDFDTDGVLRFLIFFDDFAKEQTLSFIKNENDKYTQTEQGFDQEGEQYPCSKEQSLQTPLHINIAPSDLEDLSRDLANLLNESSAPDVELKCGGHIVKAHKNILSARSQVFAKMLQADMAEGLSGQVEVRDIDYEALQHFVRFMYTGKLPELTTDTAVGFYETGDKYAIKGLVRLCVDFLVDNLTPEKSCKLLILADKHSDREFKEIVMVYILDQKIPLKDDHWQPFSSDYPLLAYEVLNRFCKLHLSQLI